MFEIILIAISVFAIGDLALYKINKARKKELPSYLEQISPRPLDKFFEETEVSKRLTELLKKNKDVLMVMFVWVFFGMILPHNAFANGVESSLQNIKNEMMSIIRILAVMGLIWAGGSFLFGKPEAKQHMIYAIVGCVVAFAAESIVSLVQSLVR